MSTLQLRAQLEPLEASAQRLGALRANELKPALRDLATLNQRLDDAWSGTARAAFDTAFAGTAYAGTAFAGTLFRLSLADADLGGLQAYLHTVTVGYRELENELIAALDEEARAHDNASTHAPAGNGTALGGAGPFAAAGAGSITQAALSGNPLEDLWNWIMSWFGSGSSPTPTPSPGPGTGIQPLNNGFAGWGTPAPTSPPWAYPLACTDATSTDPNRPQPYLNNATCQALLSQLDPAYAAQLHQQVQTGSVTLELMTIGGMVTLVAHNVATGERQAIAATIEQGDNDGQPGASGSTGSGGGGPGKRPDPNRVIETIEEQVRRVGQQRFDELSLDPANRQVREQEAQVILDLEQRDIVNGPVRRSPVGYGGDFFDADGVEWDVKQFNSYAPRRSGGFDLETSVDAIREEILDCHENIVIDTRNMSGEHIDQLWDRLIELGLNNHVIWWP